MNNREELIDDKNKVTACEYLDSLLLHEPIARCIKVGGGIATGVTGSGQVAIATIPSDKITSYDHDTNDLLRARLACDKGYLVSPLSNQNSIFYVKPEDYQTHKDKRNEIDLLKNEEKGCSLM